jgi:hypothetical protein
VETRQQSAGSEVFEAEGREPIVDERVIVARWPDQQTLSVEL